MKIKKFLCAILSFIIFATCFSAVGCGGEDVPKDVFYTITFDYNGGTGEETSRTVKYGSTVSELPTPSSLPAGRVFTCWKTKDGELFANGTTYNFEKNLKLTAQYDFEIYSITYDGKDGVLPTDAIQTYSISAEEIPLPVPTKTGSEFLGWKENGEGAPITAIPANKTGNLNLTAEWQVKSYTITFDYGEGEGNEEQRAVLYGSTVSELPTPNVLPAGKIFTGWQTVDGELFANGVTYLFESGITLTACYSTETYSIYYDVAGGNALPVDAVRAYSISAEEIPLPVSTKSGHTFLGWKENGEGAPITAIPANKTGNLNLIAVWQVNSYTITFDYGEGLGNEEQRIVEYGSTLNELPVPSFVPAGQTFADWQTDDETIVRDGNTYNFAENITLHAKYNKIPYSISYDLAGGNALPSGTITTYTVSDTNIKLPVPTRTGYEFLGWKEGEEGTPIRAIAAGTVGNKSFIAVWTDKFTVTLHNETGYDFTNWYDGTMGDKVVVVNVGKTINIPQIVYDNLSTAEKNNMEHWPNGWWYRDKNNNLRILDTSKTFTFDNLNVESATITLNISVGGWIGPY